MLKKLLFISGTLFFIAGLLILLFTFFPVIRQEITYQFVKNTSSQIQVVDNQQEAEEIKNQPVKMVKKTIVPVSFEFCLVIPKIGVNARVFPEIDSGNEEEYLPVLKKGVAHAKGSSLPDQPGPVFIFAHSTDTFYNIGRYNAVFFLLKKLNPGDQVFVFYQNRKYSYLVKEAIVIDADEISGKVKSLSGNNLILQTCWPPGTTLKRLLVVAELV